MYCKHCGAEVQEGTKFCINCGKSLTDDINDAKCHENRIPVMQSTKKPIGSKIGTVCVVLILAIALIASIAQNSFDPVDAVKDMTFSLLSEEIPFGELIEKNFMHVKWDSKEVEDDEYTVSMTGISKEYGKKVAINLSVYLDDEADEVTAYIENFEINGEVFDDILSSAIIAGMFIQE